MVRRLSPADVTRWAVGLARSSAGSAPADVLAGVAAALGVPWEGEGAAVAVEVPAAPGWELLDAAREALLDLTERRRLGAHHTPADLARRLTALALDGAAPDAVVADPACGAGAFLVAAADRLAAAGADPGRIVGRQLVGFDVDPLAVATARAALCCWARARGAEASAGGVVVGDGLAGEWRADVVVGNPPFLSPLATATGGDAGAAALRASLGAPYADVAGLFLLRALERVAPGGRVVMIQPESLLSSRDARPVRVRVAPHLEGVWVAGERVFGASIRVCAPVLRRVGPDQAPRTVVRRWRGAAVRRTGAIAFDRSAPTWGRLRPTSTPPVARHRGPTVGDLATATAGFRDEFYGLAAAATDGGTGAPLVTSGLIDPGGVAWGARSARIAGRRFLAPTVALDELGPRLRAWVDARLVPKVLVATQTKVIEAAADGDGRFVPMTPVLCVVPHDPGDVWRLAAALTSPIVTAWARHEFAGTALSADAIKLSASQVLLAPLPADPGAWSAAADALRRGEVVACGTALAGTDARLLAWWRARLPPAPPRS